MDKLIQIAGRKEAWRTKSQRGMPKVGRNKVVVKYPDNNTKTDSIIGLFTNTLY